MDAPILQDRLPFAPWMDPATARLPGMRPCGAEDWLRRDEAFAAQMARRDWLIATRMPLVHALLPEGRLEAGAVVRPDGVRVPVDARMPLVTLGRLVQEDLCLLLPGPEGHVLVGAVLCFPANWMLSQKIGRALPGVHLPVEGYVGDLERRVQRLFDGLRAGQVLERFNALVYDDPELHQPRPEGEHRPLPVEGRYLRSERQCLKRLPDSGAVLFSIHTVIVRMESLTEAERAGLAARGP
jgi:hypothetical protein